MAFSGVPEKLRLELAVLLTRQERETFTDPLEHLDDMIHDQMLEQAD